jgi:phosphohistidine phosphatase
VRARETAEIFSSEFPDAKTRVSEALIPSHNVRETLGLLRDFPMEEKVMVVGHEPHLSTLASYLLTGKETTIVEFRKAGIARIDWHGSGQGTLVFLLQPKFLV